MVLAVHKAQVLTYLRLTRLKLGIVANFGQPRLIAGWHRVVNDL
jgi:GxxExxY protein